MSSRSIGVEKASLSSCRLRTLIRSASCTFCLSASATIGSLCSMYSTSRSTVCVTLTVCSVSIWKKSGILGKTRSRMMASSVLEAWGASLMEFLSDEQLDDKIAANRHQCSAGYGDQPGGDDLERLAPAHRLRPLGSADAHDRRGDHVGGGDGRAEHRRAEDH